MIFRQNTPVKGVDLEGSEGRGKRIALDLLDQVTLTPFDFF